MGGGLTSQGLKGFKCSPRSKIRMTRRSVVNRQSGTTSEAFRDTLPPVEYVGREMPCSLNLYRRREVRARVYMHVEQQRRSREHFSLLEEAH